MNLSRPNGQTDNMRHPWRWFAGLYVAGVLGLALIAGALHALTALIS
ncbi:hypothetical protein [Mangrovitalea sediminis]|nr:hypothetical protein [Mangrovitalea sediminis]